MLENIWVEQPSVEAAEGRWEHAGPKQGSSCSFLVIQLLLEGVG